MNDLTGFQRDLLYVIAGLEEPHGLMLKDDLEDYYTKSINGRVEDASHTPLSDALSQKAK